MRDRLPRLVAALAVAVGVGAVLAGLSVFVEAWQASRAWAGSGDAERTSVPDGAPIWLDDAPRHDDQGSRQRVLESQDAEGDGLAQVSRSQSTSDQARGAPSRHSSVASPPGSAPPPARAHAAAPEPSDVANGLPRTAEASWSSPSTEFDSSGVPVDQVNASQAGLAAPADVEVTEVDFRFLDPPEPGAHARLAVTLVNRASAPTDRLGVAVPARWLQDYSVFGAIPDVVDDRTLADGDRQFVFDGLAPGEVKTLEIHVVAAGEEVDGPEVRVLVGDDAELGRVKPRTVAPRPRPGPARAVMIPKLGVKAAVVPVMWEPPPFVVGQVNGTAALSEGNTVLIGHLAGPGGEVFARLDRLRPGDEVVAVSRGLEYRFVVSEIAVTPYDDVLPTRPTGTPRLTLMTCTGQWSITRQDYSHRLWVVAEPPELAQQTIRANVERAAVLAREAEAAAAVRATHEPEADAAASAARTPEVVQVQLPPAESPRAERPDVPRTEAADAVSEPGQLDLTAAPAEERAPGLVVNEPADGAVVARRLVVRGRRTAEADPHAPLWLIVRADVEGSRWYALDRPLEPGSNGVWQADVEIGGPPGIRHEIRVGVVDAIADALLRRHAADRSGQPLDDMPGSFRMGARVVVERR